MEPDAVDSLLRTVEDRHGPDTSFVGWFSTAMIVQTGPGVLGPRLVGAAMRSL